MTDIILRDIDPTLSERIRRIGEAHGWNTPETLLHLLEHGLLACEGDARVRLDPGERDVLGAAIQALEGVPNDPGFALIGRVGTSAPTPDEPDQSIRPEFSLE